MTKLLLVLEKKFSIILAIINYVINFYCVFIFYLKHKPQENSFI